MAGILYSLLVGPVIAVHGAMHTRVSEKAGFWLNNALEQGSGFVLS